MTFAEVAPERGVRLPEGFGSGGEASCDRFARWAEILFEAEVVEPMSEADPDVLRSESVV